MQQHINFGLLVSLSNHGFSLDELVLRLGEAFETGGFPGVLSLILNGVDEALCLALTGWHQDVVADCFKPCCEHCRWELKEREERTIRTSLGKLEMRWRRLRCVSCGKSFVPLRQWLGLEKWQSKTTELEKVVVEIVSEQSYRRSSDHLERIGAIPVPRSTAHRWVVESRCDQIPQSPEKLQVLMADGTGFKRRPDAAQGKNNQGEVRVAIGLTPEGRAVALGSWSGKSWAEIGLDLEQFEQRKDGTIAEVLVSDGEPGLAEGLAGLYNRAQGCHWHIVRDLGAKLWKEGAPLGQRQLEKKALASIIALEIPAEEVQPIDPSEKAAWQQKIRQAEAELDKLAFGLHERTWHRAAEYVLTLKKRLFGYLEFWLQTGLIVPRTNSFLERVMRELGRRIKRIGFGWSEEGAAQMCRILLRRITDPKDWETWWQEKLGIANNVVCSIRDMKLITPKVI
jgi:hypothetical protein